MTIYLTRDRDEDGDLMPWIDVWLEKPRRILNNHRERKNAAKPGMRRGGYWLGDLQNGSLSPEECLAVYGIHLGTDLNYREVVR